MDRKDISFSTTTEHNKKENDYLANVTIEEKLKTITYLRECFYGRKATTGRLQRFYSFVKQQ